MLWLTVVLAVWCASDVARGAVRALDKPFYPEATHAQHFEVFKATYHKQYATPEEEQQRFEIFKNTLNSINELNAKYKETVYGITQFADLTQEEFVARHTGLLVDKSIKLRVPPLLNFSSFEVPDSFDWRVKNIVTKVKDQHTCGSCWTFGIIGCLESQYALKYNKLIDFSEKQLLDCDKVDGGCDGGGYANAVSYILANGIMTNADYPYKPEQDDFQFDSKKVAVRLKGFESYIGVKEDVLKKILYKKGPIAITLDCGVLMSYKGGIVQDCNHYKINHAVLLVGYGTENGVDYWLIKNSWGEKWGENGYFRIQRGLNHPCLGVSEAAGAEVMLLLV